MACLKWHQISKNKQTHAYMKTYKHAQRHAQRQHTHTHTHTHTQAQREKQKEDIPGLTNLSGNVTGTLAEQLWG